MRSPDNDKVRGLFSDVDGQLASGDLETDEDFVAHENSHPWLLCGVGVIAVGVLMTFLVWLVGSSPSRSDLLLSGPGVGRLQPGSVVQLAGIEVGRVTQVALVGKEPIAHLGLSAELANQLPEDSTFTVRELNLGGNLSVGIEVIAGNEMGTHLPSELIASEANALDFIQSLETETAALGRSLTDRGIPLSPAIVLLAIGLAVTVAAKIARQMIPLLVFLVIAVAIAGLLLVVSHFNSVDLSQLTTWLQSLRSPGDS